MQSELEQLQPARDRRLQYQRAVTAMPDDPAADSDVAATTPRMTRAATTIDNIPAPSTSRTYSLPEGDELEHLATTHTPKSAIRCKRTRFNTTRSVSIVEPVATMEEPAKRRASGEKDRTHTHTAPRSPTAPSNLLTKVMEQIREKVFMSSEWPNSAVMMQEKRQRANDALNASLQTRRGVELDQVQLQIHPKKKGRSKTEGARYEVIERNPNITSKSEVRQSFIRRRSISEDTYDRGLLMQMKSDILEGSTEAPHHTEHKHSLPFGTRLKRSPRPVKKHMRTQSLDSGKTGMCRTYIEPMPYTSCGSSASTLSSIRTIESGASGSSSCSIRYEYTDLQHFTQILPEIVLDKSAKETILEEASSEYDIDEQGIKRPKPVPEIIFDENGQTWDVYGADFDPEILGHAIQRHLERLMSSQSIDDDDDNVTSFPRHDDDTARSQQPSFWLRLLCMFTNKETVSS